MFQILRVSVHESFANSVSLEHLYNVMYAYVHAHPLLPMALQLEFQIFKFNKNFKQCTMRTDGISTYHSNFKFKFLPQNFHEPFLAAHHAYAQMLPYVDVFSCSVHAHMRNFGCTVYCASSACVRVVGNCFWEILNVRA